MTLFSDALIFPVHTYCPPVKPTETIFVTNDASVGLSDQCQVTTGINEGVCSVYRVAAHF